MIEQSYYVEKKEISGNVPLEFSTHIQENLGRGTMVHAHIHSYIEILYTISGEFQIMLNTKTYYFSAGDMVLINSNEIHNIQALSEGINKYIVVKFEPEMLYTTSQSLFEIKYVMPFILNESTHQKVFKNKELEKTVAADLVYQIYQEYTDKNYGYELAIRANIYNLFLFILRRWNAQNVDLNIRMEMNQDMVKRLQTVFDYVDNNYSEDITSKSMAKLCNLSYSYFSRLFKNYIRKSFRDYLNYVRITKAERFLAASDLNITEIAMKVGFSTSSYFIQQFKHYKKISPKQFRNQFIKG
jgi:AraC-type DNA-binding domain-containing proteins